MKTHNYKVGQYVFYNKFGWTPAKVTRLHKKPYQCTIQFVNFFGRLVRVKTDEGRLKGGSKYEYERSLKSFWRLL